jgi:hypothetical protein
MRVKLVCIILILFLLGSNALTFEKSFFGIEQKVTSEQTQHSYVKTSDIEISFDKPLIDESGEYTTITLKNAKYPTSNPGEPIIPYFNKVLTFPLGTEIIDVKCTFPQFEVTHLSKKIVPAPQPIPIGEQKDTQETFNQNVYATPELYPSEWYNYHTGGGLKGQRRVTFVSIHIHPIRYSPKLNLIKYVNHVTLKIRYKEPSLELSMADDTYNFLVISPLEFANNLSPLINHKNRYNISTKLVILEDITGKGRDKQEQIKYFIKDSIETWGIKYVLLVGNRTKMPVRYSYASYDDIIAKVDPFISDLYYADIYDANGSFCSWDSNNNDTFGEIDFDSENFSYITIDKVDLYPDVYIGRLLCSNTSEVDFVVDKIINYEKNTYNQQWYNNLIVCGGNTGKRNVVERFLTGNITWEGEHMGNTVINIMNTFNPTRLYASANLPLCNIYDAEKLTTEGINNAINSGAGFVFFSGHGNPSLWATHPPIFNKIWLPSPVGYRSSDIKNLTNDYRLPFVILEACSCGDYSNNTGVPSPIAWDFIKSEGGGAVACLATTALSFGNVGAYCVGGLSGYMTIQLFKGYSRGFRVAGTILARAQICYLNNVIKGSGTSMNYLTVEEWTLFGDPTLMLGGYPPKNLSPIADAGGSYSGISGENIIFDGSNSYDPDGILASFTWDFGDGCNGGGMRPIHKYSSEGTYEILLTVIDNNGATDTDTTVVTIDFLDQTQTEFCGTGRGCWDDSMMAQSFAPSLSLITRVDIPYVWKHGTLDGLKISIRGNLSESDLTSAYISADDIPVLTAGYIEFDFPDIDVTPGETYYIVWKPIGAINNYNTFYWGFGINNSYGAGCSWVLDESGWSMYESSNYPGVDFCFTTYGR